MVPREPEKCPQCHKIEDIKQTCRNCGYEYPEESTPWYEIPLMILAIIIGFIIAGFIFFTFMDWLTGEQSLIDVLKGKLEWWHNKQIL